MRRTLLLAPAVFVLVGLVGPPVWADDDDDAHHAADVDVLRTYNADANELPEGLALDKHGTIYMSFPFIGDLRRVDDDGDDEELVAKLPTGNGFGPLGLVVGSSGDIYVCVVTFDAATQGVYRVTPDGDAERLPGSEKIGFANGITFGDDGDLFVADSAGAVWRIPRDGEAEVFLADPLLVGDNSAPLPFPIGANGIAFRHDTLYVTNTELASVVTIPVESDGSAGEASVLVQDPMLGGADGIALDKHGGMMVAVIAQSTILHISADGEDIEVLADGDDGLDYASSVAFGTSHGDRDSLYAVNFSIGPVFGDVRTHGPALLEIEAGVKGPKP